MLKNMGPKVPVISGVSRFGADRLYWCTARTCMTFNTTEPVSKSDHKSEDKSERVRLPVMRPRSDT